MDANDSKAAELAEIVREIRERISARYPTKGTSGLRLPDLMPAVHARDVAASKVAAIGTVNPRPPGLLNGAAQGLKKLIARSLGWFVRDQVEFNRTLIRSIDTLIETHNETNRALADLAHRAEEIVTKLHEESEARVRGVEESLRASIRTNQNALQSQDAFLNGELRREITGIKELIARTGDEIQVRFWKEVEAVMTLQQTTIHQELRLIRQRAATLAASPQDPAPTAPSIDWMLFAQKFRGSEESIRESFRRYLKLFEGCTNVLDIGCGRGEFLELMREAGVPARGIDLNAENIVLVRHKGLDAEEADAFQYLASLMDRSLDGIFCAQVIEHLTPTQAIELIRLCSQKLRPGSPILFETPNPECLAIFATHFYLDPTHVRPVPPMLLAFYLEEAGFGLIEVTRFAQAEESMPSVRELPAEFHSQFFGELDYAISARKL